MKIETRALWSAPKCASPVKYAPPWLLSLLHTETEPLCLSPALCSLLPELRRVCGSGRRRSHAPPCVWVCARTVRVIVDRITVGTSARLLLLIKEQFHLTLPLSLSLASPSFTSHHHVHLFAAEFPDLLKPELLKHDRFDYDPFAFPLVLAPFLD